MRILFIHDDCTSSGGSNNYRKQLSGLLKEQGIQTSLFTFAINGNEEESPYYCYRYSGNIKFLRHIDHFYYNRSLIKTLRQWIDSVKPDIIHIHHNYIFPSSILLGCRGKVPVIQTLHDFRIVCLLGKRTKNCPRCLGTICNYSEHSSLMKPFYRLYHEEMPNRFLKWLSKESVKYFIVPSRALGDSMKSLGFRTFYLQHFVDLSKFHAVPLPENTNNILFVGYLHFSKGVHILLQAFAYVIKKIPSARLEIVGDGPYETELRRLSSSLKLDNHVRFCGSVSPFDIPVFYQKANLVVLPSVVTENSPLSVYEAMASARPVIGSNAGGIPDLVSENENGYLFSPGDTEDLSRKILQLLSDRKKAEMMGANARKHAESSFSSQYHIDQYLQLAETLIR